MKKILLVLLTFCIFNLSFADCNLNKLDKLTHALAKRAKIMKSVAEFKYYKNYNATVYDSKRELIILRKASKISQQYDLPEAQLLNFIQIQMDISKHIEQYWINKLKDKNVEIKNPPTLRELRKEIGKIDSKLYIKIKNNISNIKQCSVAQIKDSLEYEINKKNIEAIPTNPNFLLISASSIKNLSN